MNRNIQKSKQDNCNLDFCLQKQGEKNEHYSNLRIFYISVKNLTPKKTLAQCEEKIKKLKKSFAKLGFFLPIVVAGIDSVVLDGNARFWIAKQLGIKKIPCVRVDFLPPDVWNDVV